MTMKNNAKVIAFGAVLIWGAWTLVPVLLATLAALVAVVFYGIQAFTLPPWALGCGAAALVLAIFMTLLLREGPKKRLLRTFYVAAKFLGLLLVASGAMMLVVSNLPEIPTGAPSNVAKIDAGLSTAAFGMVEAFAWVAVVALPVSLCILTLHRVWCELHPNN
ncbi:hypothetical protein [Delftia sp. GW456-R20]|uniref:hypothetical protein n=1 Tax=Delftia sp. GW456-R20 TaxID=1827145 RepID=UPI0012E8E8DC|nr:hypothetical protein [Delftia sp. GW456-R20]